MKILFLSRWYPFPPDNGSKIRIFNILRRLCERNRVTLISFMDSQESEAGLAWEGPAPEQIHVCPYREFDSHSARAWAGFLSKTPRYIVDTRCSTMEKLIRQTVKQTPFDLVIASQLSMASYFHCFSGIPAIFEEVELGSYMPADDAQIDSWHKVRKRITWEKHRRFMAQLVENFQLCTVASENERDHLATTAPDFSAVHVFPNSVDMDQYRPQGRKRIPYSLIFAGSLRYEPNLDAMEWFLSEIYPTIRREIPKVQLRITGRPRNGQPASGPNVVFTNWIPNISTAVEESTVSIAPIRTGGGTRLKVLESFAMGTPVVATSKAVEGLEVQGGKHLLIADSPQEFARCVIQIMKCPELAQGLIENALSLVRSRYDWNVTFPRFMNLVDKVASIGALKTS